MKEALKEGPEGASARQPQAALGIRVAVWCLPSERLIQAQ